MKIIVVLFAAFLLFAACQAVKVTPENEVFVIRVESDSNGENVEEDSTQLSHIPPPPSLFSQMMSSAFGENRFHRLPSFSSILPSMPSFERLSTFSPLSVFRRLSPFSPVPVVQIQTDITNEDDSSPLENNDVQKHRVHIAIQNNQDDEGNDIVQNKNEFQEPRFAQSSPEIIPQFISSLFPQLHSHSSSSSLNSPRMRISKMFDRISRFLHQICEKAVPDDSSTPSTPIPSDNGISFPVGPVSTVTPTLSHLSFSSTGSHSHFKSSSFSSTGSHSHFKSSSSFSSSTGSHSHFKSSSSFSSTGSKEKKVSSTAIFHSSPQKTDSAHKSLSNSQQTVITELTSVSKPSSVPSSSSSIHPFSLPVWSVVLIAMGLVGSVSLGIYLFRRKKERKNVTRIKTNHHDSSLPILQFPPTHISTSTVI